ncbi:carbohydrate porin [Pseudomonas aeruginosa]
MAQAAVLRRRAGREIRPFRRGGEDFNSFPCDFQNLAFCGSQVGNWAGSIWYNWPVSQWALRVKYNFAPDWYVQVGAYESRTRRTWRPATASR